MEGYFVLIYLINFFCFWVISGLILRIRRPNLLGVITYLSYEFTVYALDYIVDLELPQFKVLRVIYKNFFYFPIIIVLILVVLSVFRIVRSSNSIIRKLFEFVLLSCVVFALAINLYYRIVFLVLGSL